MNTPNIYYTNLRPEMAKLLPQTAQKILDVGCGQGVFSENFKNKNLEMWGMEINKTEAAEAQKKYHQIIVGDVTDGITKLPEKYFDAIYCNDVLEHLIDPYTFLQNIQQKLSPTGIFIASIPNVRYFNNFINFLFKKDWKYEDSGILDRTHLRFFTQKSIIRMFDEAGYTITQINGINGYDKSWKFKIINILTLGCISDTRYLQFAVVAKPK